MEDIFFINLKNKIQPYFEDANPCHDLMHTERVLNLAVKIGEVEGGDLEIIKLAALLHDIGRKQQDDCDGKICHAEEGAKIARKILEEEKLNTEKIDKIIHCIETHRFRGNKVPESKEAIILSDADKLDSIGAIGVGRACNFAGRIGAYVHNPNINLEDTTTYSKEDSAYREFLDKLRFIKDKIQTNEGKRIAQQRHDFMEEFFRRANKECEGVL
ncbi:MAG: HD domain-containing protein [Candidatus Nanoarchaeia archaeon]